MRKTRLSKVLPFVFVIGVLALLVGTLWFLYQKSQPEPVAAVLRAPAVADVQTKTVASGAIQPRQEVEIKPKVSGILKTLHVKPGEVVKVGDLIGEVQIIPDPVGLNDAELRLRTAGLRKERARRDLVRVEALAQKGTLPEAELDRARTEYDVAAEETATASMRVELLRSGALRKSRGAATQIEATVAGTVLSIPIKEGSSVINANSFNPGTTVAFVADMSDMIFKGTIDESEVGKLEVGMPVEIVIGALTGRSFTGELEFIAPKSLAKEGTTEYEVEAAFQIPDDVVVRAGYSANANIVLDRREQVLTISESMLSFEGETAYAEVKTGDQTFERRQVKLGLSDGLKAEILEGLTADDVVRRPQLKAPKSASHAGH